MNAAMILPPRPRRLTPVAVAFARPADGSVTERMAEAVRAQDALNELQSVNLASFGACGSQAPSVPARRC